MIERILKARLTTVKEMLLPKHERFYSPDWLTCYHVPRDELRQYGEPAKLTKELIAMSEIFDVEGRDTWVKFLDVYTNAIADPIEEKDFDGTIRHLRRLIQISEQEARERWVHEIVTRTGKKIYAKQVKGKLIVFGDTYHVRDVLKKLKFQWDPVEKVWRNSANAITIDALKSALEPL
jgi:hypothetical protein